jgi:hypothetical protein
MIFKKWVLLTTFILLCFGCNKTEQDFSKIPSDKISQLHVSGAYNFYDARPEIALPQTEAYSCVGYQIKVKYPAESVISFYEEKLKGLGFELYIDSKWTGGKYEWQAFGDSTNKVKPCNCQYLRDWVNKDKTRVAMLSINYYSQFVNKRYECSPKPDNDLAYVTVWSVAYEHRIK